MTLAGRLAPGGATNEDHESLSPARTPHMQGRSGSAVRVGAGSGKRLMTASPEAWRQQLSQGDGLPVGKVRQLGAAGEAIGQHESVGLLPDGRQ